MLNNSKYCSSTNRDQCPKFFFIESPSLQLGATIVMMPFNFLTLA